MHYTTNEDFKLARWDLEKSLLTDFSEYSRKHKSNLNADKTEFIVLCKKSKKSVIANSNVSIEDNEIPISSTVKSRFLSLSKSYISGRIQKTFSARWPVGLKL